jgi:hypothetical protein
MTDSTRGAYDEARELVWYVLCYYAKFMTELEQRIERTISVEAQALLYTNAAFAAKVRERFGFRWDERVAQALEAGPETSRHAIVHRILRDHSDEIEVNRCPQCRRIVRTPQARQCFRCGHDWHRSTDSPE